jgi:transglutaminase-like putative cysteine protease
MPHRYAAMPGGYRALGWAVPAPTVAGALDEVLARMRARAPALRAHVTRVRFTDLRAKGQYLDGAAREDATGPEIRALAALVARLPPEARALELFRFVRRAIRYAADVDGEEFDDALTSLLEGEDDCDGSARAFVALCLAAGLEVRVRAVLSPDGAHLEHFQSEVLLGRAWVLAETTLAGVELGQGAEAGRLDDRGDYLTV